MKPYATNSLLKDRETRRSDTEPDVSSTPAQMPPGHPCFLNPAQRAIHQRSRSRSPNPGAGLGVSELFTASAADREVILNAIDRGQVLLAMYLLGSQASERELAEEAAKTKQQRSA